ncbi:PAS domain S-box protein [Reichenbachiella agarivorans]|uniref:histidine kinase n=1 Tax=Reichenbachiella agarivorans TaxID=2979464 RepID=A0ABY6CNL2_9BACT|nr:PAS domain S-box protein [Reichenbachiella agarivorans]UXP32105.1 PAS domain S-box protein [Reichenbachiella agarivorans]
MNLSLDLLSLLYELSLTNLNYRDPEDTARKFIRKFLSRKSLQYGAVWRIQKGDSSKITFRRIYSMPKTEDVHEIAAARFHEAFINQESCFCDQSIFEDVTLKGKYGYFKLGEFGLLELFCESISDEEFNPVAFYPFADVIKQFAISLESGYAHQNLQEEIEQRHLAEARVIASEDKFRRIIDSIDLGLLEVDNHDVIQHANKSFLEHFGYKWQEIDGKRASEIFVGSEETESIDKIAEQNLLRERGDSSSYEVMLRDKDGNKKWMIISGSPNYDENNELVGSIGIHLDITDQKRLEEDNQFKDYRLERLFQMSLDALITTDDQGKIIEWNPQAEVIFGYSFDEIKGKMLTETIIPKQHREAHKKGMEHFHRTGEGPVLNKRIEISALHKKGHEFPIELTVFPIPFKDTHFISAFIRDITEVKKGQANLERTISRQKELNNMKSQFISMTSHELRTPLTTIRSNTELASFQLVNSEDLNRERLQKNITRINDNVERLNTLINNILIIGQVDSNKVPFNPEKVVLSTYIKERVLPNLVHDREPIQFTVKGHETPALLDKNLFWHIMSNLLENALKYSPEAKSPELSVDFEAAHVIKINIKDYGMGIPEEDIGQLFDSFFRASNVGNIQGTGLGLSIVNEFIKLHEGTINVTSKLNTGTIFTILIPKIT